MNANSDLTIYNHFYNSVTDKDEYHRNVIKNISWQEKTEIQIAGKGASSRDYVLVLVSMYPDSDKEYRPYNEWRKKDSMGKSNYFTLKEGDIAIKGVCVLGLEKGIVENYSEFQQDLSPAFKIKSIKTCDYGEEHWELVLE